jgi:hypothetical protein
MFTQEIPRTEWTPFFDNFSLRHEGWMVSVEIVGRDIGDQEQARRPLAGVSAEVKGHLARIEISVGNLLDGHVVHIIETPARVLCKLPVIPGDEAIEIEDGEGRKTLVTFVRIGIGQTDRQLPET